MTYLATVLADTPLHYWRLADPPGNIANDIGSGGPLPLFSIFSGGFGCLGYSGPNADGGAAIYNNSNELKAVVGVPYATPSSYEWILWTMGPRADAHQSFPWGHGDAAGGPFHNELGTGIYAFNLKTGASVPAAAPSAQHWHHFAITIPAAGTSFVYYIDGVAQPAPAAFAAFAAGSYDFSLGNANSGSSTWVGAMSEFAIYNTQLSAARVAAHSAAVENPTSPPVAEGASSSAAGVSSSVFTGISQEILADLLNHYKNSP